MNIHLLTDKEFFLIVVLEDNNFAIFFNDTYFLLNF